MNSRDLIAMGLRNLWRRKARTFLTVLGVVIGAASIVIMISLGIAMNQNFENNLEEMGSLTLIDVYPKYDGGWSEDGEEQVNTKKIPLDDDAVQAMEQLPNVKGVMPFMQMWGTITAGKYEANLSVIGVKADQMENFDFKIAEGRLPTSLGKNEIVFGQEVANRFRDPRSRRWEEITVDLMDAKLRLFTEEEAWSDNRGRGTKLEAVGMLEVSNREYDWNAYMDIDSMTKIKETYERKNKKNNNDRNRQRRDEQENKYENVKVKVNDMENVQVVQEQIKALGLEAWSLSDILVEMQEQSKGIRMVLLGIGGVSLCVAALGITNTMIMSIYERTREIGVMKVLGAELKDIKRLFLFEAGLIGLLGGLVGLGLSFGVSYMMNNMSISLMPGFGWAGAGENQVMSVIPTWLMGMALVFSTLIGVISGYYPARRAMRLSALEAIRTE